MQKFIQLENTENNIIHVSGTKVMACYGDFPFPMFSGSYWIIQALEQKQDDLEV